MAVYLLAELEITDMAGMEPYFKAVPETLAAHGGKYLVRGGIPEIAEGGIGQYPIKVVIEFPSMAAAKEWYGSADYQAILPFRQRNSKANVLWVEGV